MNEFWQQATPIFIMYGIVLALGPFIGFAMWLGISGDAAREREAAERVAARAASATTDATDVAAAMPVAAPQLAAAQDEAPTPHRVITAAIGAA